MTAQVNNFQTLLKLYRSIMSKGDRKRTRNRKLGKLQTYPIGIENTYKGNIASFTDTFINTSTRYIDQFLRANVQTRTDSVDSDLDALMQQLDDELVLMYGTSILSSGSLGSILSTIAEKILGKNSAFMQKQIEIVAGTPIAIDQSWWPETKALWEQENYKLIKNLSTDYISKINGIITNGIQNGATIEEMAASIQKVSDSIKGWRAKYLARSQVARLNALVTRKQAEAIGIETYFWQVNLDERLRGNPRGHYPKSIPSHYRMSDLLCTYKNASVYSDDLGKTWKPKTGKMEPLHPGLAYLCRCQATLSWNSYLTELDKEIE